MFLIQARAQDAITIGKVDSLYQLMAKASHDTSRISLYHRLAETISDNSVALAYEDSAMTLAKKIKDPDAISTCFINKGAIYREENDAARANSFFRQAIDVPKQSSDQKSEAYYEHAYTLWKMSEYDSAVAVARLGLEEVRGQSTFREASQYNLIGNVRREQNQYEDALFYYFEALKIFEKIKYSLGQSQVLSNVGNIHNLLGDTDKAIAYAQKSLQLAIEGGRTSSIAYSYRLLGRIYRKQKKLDEALNVYLKAVEQYREIDALREVGETQLSIGNIYFDKGDYQQAASEYKRALGASRTTNDSLLMTYIYAALGNAYLEEDRYKLAKRYLDSTLTIADKMGYTSMQMDGHLMLSQLMETNSRFKASLDHYKKYVKIKDSLATIQNREQAQELEARYQTEKKDDEITILNAENELKAVQLRSKNNLRNFLLMVLGLTLLLVVILYNRYKIKNRANKKLQELDEMKSRFFTNVSHEFRTPLSLVVGPLQKKIEKTDNADERENLLLMYRNATRLQTMIDQILDLSRIEAGGMRLHIEEGDLTTLMRFIGGTFISFADHRSIDYSFDVPSSPMVGVYDRDKLEKIINNILSNAFKFTQDGGMVRMKAWRVRNNLCVEVTDSGVGIPEDKRDLIFNRYYRIEGQQDANPGGSGVGLALVKELVELHRGTLSVTSKVGKGSSFTITIPIDRGSYPGVEVQTAKPQRDTAHHNNLDEIAVSVADGNSDHPVIVIAEDNNDMQRFLFDLFKDRYEVLMAPNGKVALEKSLSRIPDLVISDWMMPEMDGKTLCEKLKTEERTCHIPVIMLTAKADQSSLIEGLETGADEYLVKPFDTHELEVRVEKIIEHRDRLRRVFSTQLVLQPANLPISSRDAVFVTNVLSLLEEKYADPQFGVDVFAEHFNMSRMQLHRKLKALTDQSPGDMLRKFRLERAKQLLSVPGTQVSEVCFNVGFNNVAHFSKAFKEFTGGTPSEFHASAARKN